MATGMAKGAHARGNRIAFGDGKQILWDQHSEQIFRGNSNIALPGSEGAGDLEWIPFHRGSRLYNQQKVDRWVWNYDFKPIPGEVFFSDKELNFAKAYRGGFVVIEPNVPEFKTVAPNKQWGFDRWQRLARRLRNLGIEVRQFYYNGSRQIDGVMQMKTPSFRHALAILRNARLYIGPEGGMHHGAAAVSVPAVVIFGGFIPPQVTGYDFHTNLTGGAVACGSLNACEHCRQTMDAITIDEVETAAVLRLKEISG